MLKLLYKKHKEEFIRKFKLKFPVADDDEIKNFIRIYLKPTYGNKGKDLGSFMFHDEDGNDCRIERTCFVGIYLKEPFIDHNYRRFLQNNGSGLRLP